MKPLNDQPRANATCLGRLWRPLARASAAISMALRDWNHHDKVYRIHQRTERRPDLLDDARLAIRTGFYAEAQNELLSAGPLDAECLNALGVAYEAQQQWNRALRSYGNAIRRDPKYAPAQQNIRRLYELYTFGRSREPVAFGDERPALTALMRQRVHHSKARERGTSNGISSSLSCQKPASRLLRFAFGRENEEKRSDFT
jgi:tetratricopeptide (TPR) repeat protein